MNILFVIDCLGSGGAQRQLVELATSFKMDGFSVSFLTYHKGDYYSKILKEREILETCIVESNYIKRIVKIRSFIRKGKFNGIISFLEGANFICELAGFPNRNWKLIVGERSSNPKILDSKKLKIYRWFHHLSDFIVANSYENIDIVRRVSPLLPRRKCKVIYNMVGEKFLNAKAAPRNLNSRSPFKLVVASSHNYTKNLIGLIEAINLLPYEYKERLVIEWYGDSTVAPYIDNSFIEGKEMMDKYNLNDKIKFYPATHDISGIMKSSDAIGLFSKYEGFPNAICEAMACGKPFIAPNISDLSRVINDNSFLFDPNSTSEITDAIINILSLNPAELKAAGNENRTKAELLFNREHIYNEYKSLITNER